MSNNIQTIYEGRVGINNNNPIYPLDVSGSVSFNYLVDVSNSTGITNQVLSSTGSSLVWKTIPNLLGQAYWIFQISDISLQPDLNPQTLFRGTGQPNTLSLPQGLYDIEILFAMNGLPGTKLINYYTQIANGTANGGIMYSGDYGNATTTSNLDNYTVVMGGTTDINTSVVLLNSSTNADAKAFIKGSIYVVPTIPGGTVRITPYVDFNGTAPASPAVVRNGSYFVAKYISADYSNTAGGGIII